MRRITIPDSLGSKIRYMHAAASSLALLARTGAEGLTYAGTAFMALPGSERDKLLTRLESVRVNQSPVPRLRFRQRSMGETTAHGSRASFGWFAERPPWNFEGVRLTSSSDPTRNNLRKIQSPPTSA